MPQKACKDNQIRNPKTDRCVNKDGAIGKKLLKEPKEAKQSKETKQPNGKCPETKIINPKIKTRNIHNVYESDFGIIKFKRNKKKNMIIEVNYNDLYGDR